MHQLGVLRVPVNIHRTQLFGLIVELGQKRTESKTAGSWDGIDQVTAGSVKAADLIRGGHGGGLGNALIT